MDALSRLPLDKVNFLGKGKTTLPTEDETREVLERIHMDGHLGVRKLYRFSVDDLRGLEIKCYANQ